MLRKEKKISFSFICVESYAFVQSLLLMFADSVSSSSIFTDTDHCSSKCSTSYSKQQCSHCCIGQFCIWALPCSSWCTGIRYTLCRFSCYLLLGCGIVCRRRTSTKSGSTNVKFQKLTVLKFSNRARLHVSNPCICFPSTMALPGIELCF